MIESMKRHKILSAVIWAEFIFSGALITLMLVWLLKPYDVVTLAQPIEVMNENKTIRPGERLLLKIDYSKNLAISGRVAQSILCDSGNIFVLDSFSNNIPVGKKVFISDRVRISSNIDNDVCYYQQVVEYKVHPIRTVSYTFVSEKFSIVKE